MSHNIHRLAQHCRTHPNFGVRSARCSVLGPRSPKSGCVLKCQVPPWPGSRSPKSRCRGPKCQVSGPGLGSGPGVGTRARVPKCGSGPEMPAPARRAIGTRRAGSWDPARRARAPERAHGACLQHTPHQRITDSDILRPACATQPRMHNTKHTHTHGHNHICKQYCSSSLSLSLSHTTDTLTSKLAATMLLLITMKKNLVSLAPKTIQLLSPHRHAHTQTSFLSQSRNIQPCV